MTDEEREAYIAEQNRLAAEAEAAEAAARAEREGVSLVY